MSVYTTHTSWQFESIDTRELSWSSQVGHKWVNSRRVFLLLLLVSSSITIPHSSSSFLPLLLRCCCSNRGDSLSFLVLFYYIPPHFTCWRPLRLANESWSGFLSRPRDVGGITRLFGERLFPSDSFFFTIQVIVQRCFIQKSRLELNSSRQPIKILILVNVIFDFKSQIQQNQNVTGNNGRFLILVQVSFKNFVQI